MDKSNTAWKDHPLAVATIAAVGALGLTILVFKEIVIPTQIAAVQNDNITLRKQLIAREEDIRGVDALKKQVDTLKKQTDDLKEQLKLANSKVVETQLSNPFVFGNPYPTGLGQVRIGDPISAISKAYSESTIDREEKSYWSVKLDHAAFREVVYYFDRRLSEKDRKVTQILLFTRPPLSDDVLQSKLIEAFGQPTSTPKRNIYVWKVSPTLFLFRQFGNSITLRPTEPNFD